MGRRRGVGRWGLGFAVLGAFWGTGLAVVALGACSKGPINVPHECADACSERQYCVATIRNDASLTTECPSFPNACKEAPDACECVRTTKGPPHYHCMSSDAGVVLVSP